MSLKKGKFQHNQSKSLWNYTLSPGWREEEVKILKSALQLFGIGKWKKIMESGCLPGKSIGQIYMQTQRLLGQQSLGDYMGLQVDLEAVFNDNMKKQDVLRKNNCIINTGDNPTKEERKRRIEQNRKIYGLSAKIIKDIKLPKVKKHGPEYMTLEDIENEKFTNLEILTHLYNLKAEIVKRLADLGDTDAQSTIIKGILNFKPANEGNQNSNSSTETKMTLEQSGRKKYKLVSVEETVIQDGVATTTTTNGTKIEVKKTKLNNNINNKRKNNKKIASDSEGMEEEDDISLEDIDSQESDINSEEIEEDDNEEVEEPPKTKKRKNPEQESEDDEDDDEIEEDDEDDEEGDENVVNEEEIFEDDDDDEELAASSDEDDE